LKGLSLLIGELNPVVILESEGHSARGGFRLTINSSGDTLEEMANHSNSRGHRKKIEINFKELEKLCFLQCSELEVAEWFHCSIDTIARRVREKFGVSFAEYFAKKRVGGLISLRRNQFNLTRKSAAMAIFLGKNYLGQKDAHEVGGIKDQPVEVEINAKSKLIDELARYAARAGAREDHKEAAGSGS